MSLLREKPPTSEPELLRLCQAIEGFSFAQLSLHLGMTIPDNPNQRKGWVGMAIERALGADAFNLALPDFQALGIELKTLPLSLSGKPTESTFITSIPLLSIHQQNWLTSQCYAKLRRVLWLPVEGDTRIPYPQRRLGRGVLWSPSAEHLSQLEKDWTYLTTMIITGQLESVDARHGEYLQIRPKAADGKSLCFAFDAQGNKIQTLPRGFYLRSSFTAEILSLRDA